MAIDIIIGGVSLNNSASHIVIKKDTLDIENAIFEHPMARFDLTILNNTFNVHLEEGVSVRIVDGLETEFAGVIVSTTEKGFTAENNLDVSVECISNVYFTRTVTYSGKFKGVTVASAIWTIVNEKLSQEGITIGKVNAPAVIGDMEINAEFVDSILDRLAVIGDYWWYIANDKKLYFEPKGGLPSPIVLDNSLYERDSLKVERYSGKYRNVQVVSNCKAKTQLITEYRNGDGETESFSLKNPVYEVVSVGLSRNGSPVMAQTVAPRDKEESVERYDWYFQEGENVLYGSSYNSPISVFDRLEIKYYGLILKDAIAIDSAEILLNKELSGGSGRVEQTIEGGNITIETGQQLAQSILDRYKYRTKVITYNTRVPGIKVGLLQSVNLPYHGVVTELLVTKVTTSYINDIKTYSVTLEHGYNVKDWVKFYLADHQNDKSLGGKTVGGGQSLGSIGPSQKADQLIVPIYPQDPLNPLEGEMWIRG